MLFLVLLQFYSLITSLLSFPIMSSKTQISRDVLNPKLSLLKDHYYNLINKAEAIAKIYQNIEDVPGLLEGDIIPPQTLIVNKSGIWKPPLWPNATVIYQFDEAFREEEQAKILSAWADISSSTCVKFQKRVDEENFVLVERGNNDEKNPKCFSDLGYQETVQTIHYSKWCLEKHGSIIHEMLHTLGFSHEQGRPDRDNYVTIIFDKIKPGKKHNFKKNNDDYYAKFGIPYDFGSVLHYSRNAFSVDGNDTVMPKVAGAEIGQRNQISENDLRKVALVYCDG